MRRSALPDALANAVGVKSLGINLDALPEGARAALSGIAGRRSKAASSQAEPGTIIVVFRVVGRPVPWKVSIRRRGKGPPTNPKFAAWKRSVATCARMAMGDRLPYAGLFEFRASFDLIRRGPMPDLGNLAKGTLDALEGIVVENDRMCRGETTTMNADSDCQGVTVKVVAL